MPRSKRRKPPSSDETARDAVPSTLEDWLARALDGDGPARRLMPFLRCAHHPVGTYVCRQGEPTDTLLFIETGRVGVLIGSGADERRVRVFGPHTIAGEQGFVLRTPRSASLKVEQDATVWSLSRESFDELAATQGDVVVALMRDIIRIQSERLSFATRQAELLR